MKRINSKKALSLLAAGSVLALALVPSLTALAEDAEAPVNVLANATNVDLYEIRHDLDWSELEAGPDYSATTELRLSTSRNGAPGDFFGLQYGADGEVGGFSNASWLTREMWEDAAVAGLSDGVTDKLVVATPVVNPDNAEESAVFAYDVGIGAEGWGYEDPTYKDADGNAVTWEMWKAAVDSTTVKAAKYRSALMYEMGAYYDLTSITVTVPDKYFNATGAEKTLSPNRTVYGYSVYVGNTNDASLLSEENLAGRFTQTTQVKGDLTVTFDETVNGSYVLVVFDYLATDPGVYNDSKWDDADSKCQISTMTGYGAAHTQDYGIWISEVSMEGEKTADLPLGENILANNEDVSFQIALIEHELDWSDSFENGDYDYTPEDFSIYATEVGDKFSTGWVNGEYEEEMCWAHGFVEKNITHRRAILIDLGKFYDVSAVQVSISKKNQEQSRRYIYDYSVYGGPAADSSLMNNLIGHSGGTNQHEVATTTSTKSIRYVLLVFNKLGTDPGNLNDQYAEGGNYDSLGGNVNREGALPGCTWADAGLWFSELEVYGTEGVDPTDTDTVTDEESGVEFSVLTYDNDTYIETMKIVRNAVTAEQKAVLEPDALYPVGDESYKLVCYDAQGNVIDDFTGRQITITVPYVNFDEALFAVDAEGAIAIVDFFATDDLMAITYSCSGEAVATEYIVVTATEPEVDDNTGNNTGDNNTGDNNTGDNNTGDNNTGDSTGDNVGDNAGEGEATENPETGYTAPVAVAAMLALSGAALFMTRKNKK